MGKSGLCSIEGRNGKAAESPQVPALTRAKVQHDSAPEHAGGNRVPALTRAREGATGFSNIRGNLFTRPRSHAREIHNCLEGHGRSPKMGPRSHTHGVQRQTFPGVDSPGFHRQPSRRTTEPPTRFPRLRVSIDPCTTPNSCSARTHQRPSYAILDGCNPRRVSGGWDIPPDNPRREIGGRRSFPRRDRAATKSGPSPSPLPHTRGCDKKVPKRQFCRWQSPPTHAQRCDTMLWGLKLWAPGPRSHTRAKVRQRGQ